MKRLNLSLFLTVSIFQAFSQDPLPYVMREYRSSFTRIGCGDFAYKNLHATRYIKLKLIYTPSAKDCENTTDSVREEILPPNSKFIVLFSNIGGESPRMVECFFVKPQHDATPEKNSTDSPHEGKRIKSPGDTSLYLVLDSRKHRVPESVYEKLFGASTAAIVENDALVRSIPTGIPFSKDSRL